jgi:hypothetical protein
LLIVGAPSLCCNAVDAIDCACTLGHRLRESPRKVKRRSSQFRNLHPRRSGAMVAFLTALVCLLAGALHQLRDLQVNEAMFRPAPAESLITNLGSSGKIEISRANVVAEHDKDDSFSVKTLEQMIVLALVKPPSILLREPRSSHPDSPAAIEIPPPRYLT